MHLKTPYFYYINKPNLVSVYKRPFLIPAKKKLSSKKHRNEFKTTISALSVFLLTLPALFLLI